MKNLKKLFAIAIIAMLGAALSLTACDKDDDEDNGLEALGTMTYGENTVNFTKGYFADNGIDNTNYYNYTITLANGSMTYEGISGSGDILMFDFYDSNSTFSGGSYTINQFSTTPGSLYVAMFMKNYTENNQSFESIYMAQSGSLNVTKSGSIYDLQFSLIISEFSYTTLELIGEEITATGTFSGELQDVDEPTKTGITHFTIQK